MTGRPTPLTDEDLRAGLEAIARWGTPASTPPLRDVPAANVAAIGTAHNRRHAMPQRAGWWAAAAAVVLALVMAASVLNRPAPAPIAAGRWTDLAPAPIPARSLAASVWTGTEVVVVGGQEAHGSLRRDAAAYNPATNSWRRLPDAPEPIPPGSVALWTGTEVAVLAGTLDVLTNVPSGTSGTNLSAAFALDVATGSWRRLPQPPHYLATATVVDGTIVGLVTEDTAPVIVALGADGTWEQLAAFSDERTNMHHARQWRAFPVGGRAVFFSSEWISLYLTGQSAVGFAVDVETSVVEPIARPPVASTTPGNIAAMVMSKVAPLGDTGLLAMQRTYTEQGDTIDQPLRYDFATRTFRKAERLKRFPRTEEFFLGMSLTPVGDDAILLGGIESEQGGGDAGGLRRAYDRDADRWRTLPAPDIRLDRVGHTAVWTGEELVVWGGLHRTGGVMNRADTPADSGAVYRFGR